MRYWLAGGINPEQEVSLSAAAIYKRESHGNLLW